MYAGHDDQVCASLAESGGLGAERIEEAREEARRTGASVAQVVLNRGWLSQEELLAAVADYLGFELAHEIPASLAAEAYARLPADLARRLQVIPWREEQGRLAVLAADPFRPALADDLSLALERPVRPLLGDPGRIEALWRRGYGEPEPATATVEEVGADDSASAATLAALAAQAPVVRFVNGVLAQAVRERASDLHFEPFDDDFRVRCRIDGALFDLPPPPKELARAVTSRLKVLAQLDIAERRRPQDGRLRLTVAGRPVDLRVSTLPTQFGESVVLRVLDRATTGLELEELGFPATMLAAIEDVVRRPHGMFVVTGPTGSGKTTTLYSCLKRLNEPGAKLLTVEDPVEYEIEGVMQVPVNPAAGLTFASALRSFLRHDPDVVMVGEIRDLETAQIAIQAALTGHFVLTTLHTNDAPGAITRLTDMGVEPFLLASTVEAVLAQRLVRRLCPDCREVVAPEPGLLARLELTGADLPGAGVWQGRGCGQCHGSGYRGRLGFFELFAIDDGLRELIARGAPLQELREATRARGMRPLREDGVRLVREGITSLDELARYV